MTGDKIEYNYLSKEVPKEKINYSYSKYYGRPFIRGWFDLRNSFLEQKQIRQTKLMSSSNTGDLLLLWQKKITSKGGFDYTNLNLLIKRFEVTKKIYNDYNKLFRPVKTNNFSNLTNYLLFAGTLICAYQKTEIKSYLNALIKVNDICCSLEIDEVEQKKYFQNNILHELKFIDELMIKLEIK